MAKKKKGARGGVKHTPGRDHVRKSDPAKKKRFRRKAAKRRQAKEAELRKPWDHWDSLSPDAQKLLRDEKPRLPRPDDES